MGKKLRQKAAKYTPPRNKNAFAFREESSNNHTGSNTPKPYFSLRDELQSTEKHEWTKESRLRDHKVSFVSAGSMAPIDEPKIDRSFLKKTQNHAEHDRDLRGSEDAMAQMDINAQPSVAMPSLHDDDDEDDDEVEMEVDETVHIHAEFTIPVDQFPPQQQSEPSPPTEDAPMFFVDTAGDESLAFKGTKSVPAPRACAPSPARSSSSDEVVFRGRAGVTIRDDPPAVAQKPATKPAPKPSSKSSKPIAQPVPKVNPQLEKFLESLDNPPEWAKDMSENSKPKEFPKQPAEHWPSMEEANGFADRLDQDLSGVHASRKSKKNRKKQNRIFRLEQDLEDELLRDYIDNIAAEDMPTRARGLGGDSGDDTDDFFDDLLNEEEKDPDDVDVTGLEDEWEDESDSDEEEEEDDEDEDDDNSSEDSSELEERLAREEREAWEDDADIRERRAQAMTDEELALLFMKQEELGIDGDDIMLYDDRFGDVDGARAGLANYSVKQTPKSGKKKKGGRKSDHFPDATLMADVLEQDAYGGFDVMDYDRPSLRKKNKGRKSGPLPEELGLSDSDLVEELQNQWANDRSKKASKKAEREELRQLGLLGKKNKFKPDMNQRYTEGITMGQVRFELQDFLEEDDMTTKAFPPMQKNDRKVLHEIANHFNLKSKSVGSGKNRAPVLIKTSRTIEWSSEHFTRATSFVGKGYMKNSSRKPKTTGASEVRRTRAMGGGGGGAAAYRNGDVVGHNASEIPATNFGRKLMEKMGWAAGMSLGKEGSGGLLVPVQATVKSGKAGLG
ncbi:hypothetical protein E4T50_14485 [Aureobasidium sp. EXF-12298]|nr:hypothetical protein E4T50_14485 [Aureobasidium sp. EXF-12298]